MAKATTSAAGTAPNACEPKRRLDLLLCIHAATAVVVGAAALVAPHFFGVFLDDGLRGSFRLWSPSDDKVKLTHVVIRMYGALILGQAWIVFNVQGTTDGAVRKQVVRAYFAVFALTLLPLLQTHLSDALWHASNWLNIGLFLGLAAAYGWFSLAGPEPAFASADKSQ